MSSTTTLPAYVPEADQQVRRLPQWNLILLDDDQHTYDYVVEMLQKLLGHSQEVAWTMAEEVDRTGRSIIATTTKERAELKHEQVAGFGPDWRLKDSKTSMQTVLEPVTT